MHLYEVPLIFVLVGLVLYAVLAGADFGAGFWQLLAGPGERGAPIRDHVHEAMAPVWEANHVWLIFVLTVTWTAYPSAFGAIASTLCVPLFVAGLGIVMRGATYALRAGAASTRERDRVDLVFALSSVLTPFALGTMIGAIAARRVPLGNAAGGLFSSWTGATPLLVGALALANSAYIAAVFLAADAQRTGRPREPQEALRTRALATGALAGLVAVAGLVVLRFDAHFLYTRLLEGGALAAVVVSALAGLATLALVFARLYEPARYSAALAVAAVIAGWALAQRPVLLKGLTVQQAAAPHDTLVLVIVAVLGGGLILFPSLALLFRLVLRGRLDYGEDEGAGDAPGLGARGGGGLTQLLAVSSSGLLTRIAGACLVIGFGTLTVAEAGWAHAIGVVALLGFICVGFLAIVPAQLAGHESD
jgi:cytochrome d ubiquinol oxidase subunit II